VKYPHSATGILLGSAAILVACGGGGSATSTSPSVPSVQTVSVTPSSDTLLPGATVSFVAIPRDATGAAMGGQTVSWSSSPQSVAIVSVNGLVTAVAAGTAVVSASVAGKSGSATVFVRTAGTVRSVALDYPSATLARGQVLALKLTLRDSTGSVVTKPGTTWTTTDSGVVRVDPSGTLTAASSGSATVTASIDGASATSTVTVVSFASIKAGPSVTCALTSAGVAYCAGAPFGSQAVRLSGSLQFTSLESGGEPPGGIWHSCGLVVDKAYCWGTNGNGQLGVGDSTGRNVPTPVAGNLSFAQLSVGEYHTCGLTTAGDAYCWGANATVSGYNSLGALGVGDTLNRYAPTAVLAGLKFKQIEAGWGTTCAVTVAGDAYCWGRNELGEVGSADSFGHLGDYVATPAKVIGGLTFKQAVTRGPRSCGLTVAGQAYCWGNNTVYETGNAQSTAVCYGGKSCSGSPVAVSTSTLFSSLSTSQFATCGLTSTHTTECWGLNRMYVFGTSNVPTCPTPGTAYGCTAIPVSGPANLVTVSGAVENFCGMGSDGVAYCWGGNDVGQRGWPGSTPDPTPRPFSIAPQTAASSANSYRPAVRR
jgi:Bacterial Ig-like domain (group 2)/Regulator of chromosome condensation (RCC1) repeat